MKVKELVELLQKQPQDKDVVLMDAYEKFYVPISVKLDTGVQPDVVIEVDELP